MKGVEVTPQNLDQCVAGIAAGLTIGDACALAGIDRRTFWVHRKNDPALDLKVQRAYISFKLKHIKNIQTASESNWTASAWLLERKFPEEFGAKQSIEVHQGPPKVPSWFADSEQNRLEVTEDIDHIEE